MQTEQKQAFRLILASGSPRRRELLAQMGYEFEIIVPEVDEHIDAPAGEAVAILSRRKAQAVAKQLRSGVVIASDTLVSLNGRALGKPENEAEAFEMLAALSGNTHEVFTGVTLLNAADGRSSTRSVRTGVRFRRLSDEEIRAYIRTGEPMDKAGAYGIQGGAGAFVEALDGSLENVIGFPVDDVQEMLTHFINSQEQ